MYACVYGFFFVLCVDVVIYIYTRTQWLRKWIKTQEKKKKQKKKEEEDIDRRCPLWFILVIDNYDDDGSDTYVLNLFFLRK